MSVSDAELHAVWCREPRLSLAEMGALLGLTRHAIEARVSRARAREGEAKWPRRPSIIPKQRKAPMAQPLAPGTRTLPPLPSEEGA